MSEPLPDQSSAPRPGRLLRAVRRIALVLTVILLLGGILVAVIVKDHVRTMWSVRQVEGTKLFAVDYYGSYNIEKVRDHGIDVADPVASLARVFFPDFLGSIVARSMQQKLPPIREPIRGPAHSCSTVAFRTKDGQVLVGRNFDWMHDPCVVLQVHGRNGGSSVAVLDPHYLGLDAKRLAHPSVADRFLLLFLPYLVMDGMNEHGVAVTEMALDDTRAPFDSAKPSLINPLALRLILDYARDTDAAVAIMRSYNLHFPAVPCHYLIADAKGKTVVVEFIDGRVETIPTGESWQVSTNHRLLGKSEAENDRACWRYRTASDRVAQLDGKIDAAGMLDTMAAVSVKDWTMWSSVYNLSSGEFRVAYRRNFTDLYTGRLKMR